MYCSSNKLIMTRFICSTIYETFGMNRRWHQTTALLTVISMVMVVSPLFSSLYAEMVCTFWVPTIKVSIPNYRFVAIVVECLRPEEWFCIAISLFISKRILVSVLVSEKNITPFCFCVLALRGQRPISVRTYFRHICSLGVNFMQLWFFVVNWFPI